MDIMKNWWLSGCTEASTGRRRCCRTRTTNDRNGFVNAITATRPHFWDESGWIGRSSLTKPRHPQCQTNWERWLHHQRRLVPKVGTSWRTRKAVQKVSAAATTTWKWNIYNYAERCFKEAFSNVWGCRVRSNIVSKWPQPHQNNS